jgi:hypothetical protein
MGQPQTATTQNPSARHPPKPAPQRRRWTIRDRRRKPSPLAGGLLLLLVTDAPAEEEPTSGCVACGQEPTHYEVDGTAWCTCCAPAAAFH